MAKKLSLPKKSNNVEEIEDNDTVVSAEFDSQDEVSENELTAEEVKVNAMTDLVSFTSYEEIRPAPTVGNISMVRDLGMSFLPRGVSKIPRNIAIVLEDKKLGQIFR